MPNLHKDYSLNRCTRRHGSQAPNEGPYANYNTFGTSAENVITYNINSETNVYTAGDGGDAVFGTLSDEVSRRFYIHNLVMVHLVEL